MTAAYTLIGQIYGHFTRKQKPLSDEWHVYALEWTEDWARVYVDDRLGVVVDLRFKNAGEDGWFWKAAK